jgi:hypothetical protein
MAQSMIMPSHRLSIVIVAIAAGLTGCSSDDDDASSTPSASTPSDSSVAPATNQPLVIVTERQGTDGALHYLHVVSSWPSDGKLDYKRAIELGTPGLTHAQDNAIFFYHAEEGVIQKFAVDKNLKATKTTTMSFDKYQIKGFDPEPIWVKPDLAFFLDEKTAQIVRWNPTTMKISNVDPVNPDVLEVDGLKVQFQLGIATGGRLFTDVNWRNWDTNKVHAGISIGVFDQEDPANGPQIVQDDRCAASVAVGPFKDDDGYIYAVGDGAQGYDMVANPNKSKGPQCVRRLRDDANEFDPDYFIDLQEVTGSPAIYMVYPMSDHKLLVNMWSPDVDITEHADPKAPGWYWELNPYFEYAIVDLTERTSTKVEGLPRASIQSQKTLVVDGKNYVQSFRDDRGSTLYRVDLDGTVTQVLDNPTGTNVQYIGRL